MTSSIPKPVPVVTGWDNGLCQDYNKKLARWFSTRLDARQKIRELFPINKGNEMNLNTQWKNWAEAFITAVTAPMDKQISKVFMICCMTEIEGKDLPAELKGEFLYRIIDMRAQFIGLDMTDAVKAMLCVLCSTPGMAVMYVYAMRYYQVKHKLESVDTLQFARAFPMGFPTEAELSRLWDLQKDSAGNLLDKITKEITGYEKFPTNP